MDLAVLSFCYEGDPHSQDYLIKSEMRTENLSVKFMEWRQLTQPSFLFNNIKKNNFIEVQCTFNKMKILSLHLRSLEKCMHLCNNHSEQGKRISITLESSFLPLCSQQHPHAHFSHPLISITIEIEYYIV